jgi:S1-C subfamily serine protease
MKKLTLTSILLIFLFLVSACSSPSAMLSEQLTDVLQSAASTKALAAEPQENQTSAEQQDVNQPYPAPDLQQVDVTELLAAYQGALENIYVKVNPSVVNINVLQKATGYNFEMPEGMPEDMPFQFPSIPGFPQSPEAPEYSNPEIPQYNQGLGSGFVWDEQGHIVTNNHVVEGADEIEVTFYDGTTLPAELIGSDPDSDLAVIKVDAGGDLLEPVSVANSDDVRVGQMGIAIGNPFGLEGTMTVGIISAIGRSMPVPSDFQSGASYSIPDVIQTDAPINPGNSGGVLVNDQGQVVGVTFAIESTNGSNAGIGFVIPSNIVQRVVPELISDGSFAHPYLGISGISLVPDIAEAMDLESNQRGVMVAEVPSGGPSDKAGLRGSDKPVTIDGQQFNVGGDVIIAINNELVKEMDDLIAYLSSDTEVGQEVTLTILRDGRQIEVEVKLEARPGSTVENTPAARASQGRAWLGIQGANLTSEMAEEMDLPSKQSGVLVENVQTGSPADEGGLRGGFKSFEIDGQEILIGGDVIVSLNGENVDTINDLIELLGEHEPGDEVTLSVLRDGEEIDLEITLGTSPQ